VVGVSAFARVVLFFSLFFLYALASAKTKNILKAVSERTQALNHSLRLATTAAIIA
jgi:hypothetical protein